MLNALQVITFCMGATSFGLAVRFYLFFVRSNHHLSRTMRFFLVEQIVTSLGTLAFSTNSLAATLTGVPESEWNNVTPELAIAIRVAMFGAMIQSTTALSLSVMRVVADNEKAMNNGS